MHRVFTILLPIGALLLASGCSSLPPSMLPPGLLNATSSPAKDPLAPGPRGAANPYEAVSKAAEQQAVVLQVAGAEQPSRIIPLPSDGRAVHVSDLLRQSGLSEEFSRMKATLHRGGSNAIDGIKMGIMFDGQTTRVLPEYDYALRPGDRLQVVELEVNPFESLSNLFSPPRKRRPVFAY